MSTLTPSLPSLDAVKGVPEYIDPETVPDGFLHHIRYALKRGISASVMSAAAWTSVDSREAAEAVFDDQCGGLRYHKLVAERLDDGALILPRLRIDGTPGVPQVRLDNPRPKEDGGTIKFETPGSVSAKKAGLVLAPSAPLWWAPQSWVNDPAVPVIISEGPSRELAMVTAAIREQVAVLPVTLTGVAMGTGRRKEEGEDGKTRVVERWLQEDIAKLAAAGKGRAFFIAFDHDVLQKKQVHAELGHLVRLLREAGAAVRVIIPPAQGEDTSAGLDDAIAAGVTLQQMVAESREDLPSKRKPRAASRVVTPSESAQESYEDQALSGEVVAPESPDVSHRAVNGAGQVIDMTPPTSIDVTSVESIDQITSTMGLPTAEFQRTNGSATWEDSYAAPNLAMGLASFARNYFRYIKKGASWIRYDGRRWISTEVDEVRLFVEGVIRAERVEAVAGVQGEDPSDDQKTREIKSTRLLGSRYADDVITSLKARLKIDPMSLDADPDVLNVLNGTLDLKSGELRPHHPDDLISKLAPVAYRTEDSYGEDEADRLAWAQKAVRAVVNSTGDGDSDKEVQDHLELLMGQGITGHRPYGDPSLVIMEGGASNGKTSRFELLQATLGDYCVEVTPAVFREDSSSSNERVDLWGARVVIVEELTSRGGSVEGGTLKQIVGKKSVRARPLYSEWVTFPFTARIFASTNDQLRIIDDDDGVWRRLQRVLHPYTYVENPKTPRQRKMDVRMETVGEDSYVREEWLRLLLRGAMRWYQMPDRALPSHKSWPEKILRDTAVWRTDEDPIGRMITDLLEPCEGSLIPLRDLLSAAEAWRRVNMGRDATRSWSAQTIRNKVLQSPTVRDEWGVTITEKPVRMSAERSKMRSTPRVRKGGGLGISRQEPRSIDNAEHMAIGMKFTDYVLPVSSFEW